MGVSQVFRRKHNLPLSHSLLLIRLLLFQKWTSEECLLIVQYLLLLNSVLERLEDVLGVKEQAEHGSEFEQVKPNGLLVLGLALSEAILGHPTAVGLLKCGEAHDEVNGEGCC